MSNRLEGTVALVTGAGRNIGRAIAVALAREGADVAVNVRSNLTEAEETCQAVRAEGVRSIAVLADVADRGAVFAMADRIREELGPVSTLINNVGIRPHTPFLDITDEEWFTVINAGLTGAFHCSQAVIPHMIDSGRGRIVNISGRDGFVGRAQRAHGVTVKAGLHGFTKALAVEFGPSGITTNTVVPGVIRTERPWEHYPNLDYEERATRLPVRRVGSVEDIARTCVFFAVDEGFINGTAIHVNGGESLF